MTRTSKLVVNAGLSLTTLAACAWLFWPSGDDWKLITGSFTRIDIREFWPYLAGFIALLALTHFFRAWRWRYLLRPIGVELPPMRLLAISTVGFMAILALPVRLGEFVRPALVRKRGEVSAVEALGTIVVERIVDGLLISLLVFAAIFALRDSPNTDPRMVTAAYVALAIFGSASLFLALSFKWPEWTVNTSLSLTLLPRFAPRVAGFIRDKLHQIISGFRVLQGGRNLAAFLLWTCLYWFCNAMGMLVLSRGFGLELSVVGALATMGVTTVGIMLPNTPGLVFQFHVAMVAGLTLYVGSDLASTTGKAVAITCHGIQLVWYIGLGALALASRHVSFAELVASRKLADDPEDG